ncbi:MAG TPA: LemA family protein [Candidatus Merdenecus merdavium]|nr:LemA family protein [Candidatus Merdenecus merdavium]
MNGATKVLLGILAVIVIIVGFFILKYNGLVREDENVKTQYSNISVQLQRRNDLIPNLVNTVKGYAAHETEVFQAVSDARERMMGADTINEGVAADNELSQALGRLLAVAEAYPELKANENFLSLQDQLEGTENRISTARRDYNEAAKSFNTKLRSFPNNIIGGMFGFEKHDLFEAQPGAEIAPEVDFES